MATPLGSALGWWGGQAFLDSGAVANGCKMFFYLAGTATKHDTWSDSSLTTLNTNPVVLNSAGRATIFTGPVTYKIVLATPTSADPPVGADIIATLDGYSASSSLTNTNVPIVAGESITAGQWVYLSDGSGGLTAGRWYLTDADQTYSSVLAKQIGISNDTLAAGESGTALQSGRYELLSGTVVAGTEYYLSATNGAITATAPTNARRVAFADTTTSLVISFWQPTAFFTGVMPGGTNTTTVGNVGAGEDDLMSYTVNTSLVAAANANFEFLCFGTTGANANTKQIRVYVDGSLWLDTGAVAYNAQAWVIRITVMIRSQLSNGTTGLVEFTPDIAGAGVLRVQAFSTATVAGTFIVKVTGESVSVPATNDVIQYGMISRKLT